MFLMCVLISVVVATNVVRSATPLSTANLEEQLFYLDQLSQSQKENSTCRQLLMEFSQISSQFILCANQNAKPISMCRECMQHVLDITEKYHELSRVTENGSDENGIPCKEILTSQDRVEILKTTFQFIAGMEKDSNNAAVTTGLWNKGNCNNCYHPNNPITNATKLSKETEGFFERHHQVEECFKQFHVEKDMPRNESSACDECRTIYQNLTNYYRDHIQAQKAPFIANVCYDILDAINMTQRTWGEHFNCGRSSHVQVELLVAIATVLMLPAIFYPVCRYAGTSAEERVISQRHIQDFLDSSLRKISFSRRRSHSLASARTPHGSLNEADNSPTSSQHTHTTHTSSPSVRVSD